MPNVKRTTHDCGPAPMCAAQPKRQWRATLRQALLATAGALQALALVLPAEPGDGPGKRVRG